MVQGEGGHHSAAETTVTSVQQRPRISAIKPRKEELISCASTPSFVSSLLRHGHETARRVRVVGTPASCLGGPGFKSEPRDRLS
jgi:hypothetical protein